MRLLLVLAATKGLVSSRRRLPRLAGNAGRVFHSAAARFRFMRDGLFVGSRRGFRHLARSSATVRGCPGIGAVLAELIAALVVVAVPTHQLVGLRL